MRIAIIGAGNVGTALARGLKGKGHSLTLGVRDPSSPKALALAGQSDAALAFPAAAAAASDIVILALPWWGAEEAVKGLGDLSGRIVIDCTNPLAMVDGELVLSMGHNSSGGETIAGWLPGARVVKTLNTVGAEMMEDNAALAHRPVMFMAGDDAAAKACVAEILCDLGFEPLDAGDITKSRLLEPFGMVWINQSLFRGKGRNWAFAAVEAAG
ncbi:MAG: NADPH-dependent F420 reductase [Erythrobacter sp.]